MSHDVGGFSVVFGSLLWSCLASHCLSAHWNGGYCRLRRGRRGIAHGAGWGLSRMDGLWDQYLWNERSKGRRQALKKERPSNRHGCQTMVDTKLDLGNLKSDHTLNDSAAVLVAQGWSWCILAPSNCAHRTVSGESRILRQIGRKHMAAKRLRFAAAFALVFASMHPRIRRANSLASSPFQPPALQPLNRVSLRA